MQIAFATYDRLPDLDPDDRLVVPHLERAGCEVRAATWDDPAVDWDAFDLVVLRSCWDYDRKVAPFRAWLDRLDDARPAVHNGTGVVRWNLDKRHLKELEASGIRVVPTLFVDRGDDVRLADLLDELGAEEAVVKPTISMSANGTWRTGHKASGDEERWREQLGHCDLMVQRYMPEIEAEGEWSLIYIDGVFDHACRKTPAPGDFRVQTELGGARLAAEPPADLVRQASDVLGACPGDSLYARVDGVRSGGALVLMEVELIDPSLFLEESDGSAERFARAILAAG